MEKKRFVTNNLRIERSNIADDGDKYIVIKGYACHFNEPNHNGEVVTEGSFDSEMLAAMKENDLMPAMNLHHGCDIVGVWDRLTSDENGLIAEGRIFREARINNIPIADLLESGALNHLSTEGWTNGWWDEEADVWHAEKFYLTAISLVALPADFGAGVEMSENKLLLERKSSRRNANGVEVEKHTEEVINRGISAYLLTL